MATTVDLDWKNLSFGYLKTDYNIRSYFRNGAWTTPEMTSDETVNLHMAATGLHYGQEAFEGLKAFRGVDGQVRIFRADENGKRLASSAEYLRMAVPPLELFIDMVKQVVKANERFIPPYGTGASLYIRPVLFGSGPQVGVKPADEYLLIIFVTPVGPYYKEGFNPIRVIIDRDHDRAAPLGTGHIKAGGNYGASLISSEEAHDKGYPSVLYLDAKEKKHIDECGAANFFGIRDGRYITPKSHSVLPSITNMSLMTLAADLGLKVESRPVEAEELSTFSEAGACGTAAVISPIGSIYDPETNHTYTYNNGEPGEWSKKLYHKLRAIQYARMEPGSGIVRIFFPHRPGKGCGAGGIRKQICCGAPERCAVFFVRCDEKRERFRALFLPLPWPGPAGRYRTRVANGMFAFTLPLEFSPGKAIFVFVKFFLFCTVAVSTCWN